MIEQPCALPPPPVFCVFTQTGNADAGPCSRRRAWLRRDRRAGNDESVGASPRQWKMWCAAAHIKQAAIHPIRHSARHHLAHGLPTSFEPQWLR